MATAIITGGSAGLGLLFAEALAEQGLDLILIARDKARLKQVCRDLAERHHVAVEPIAIDLADPDNAEIIAKVISKTKDLLYLINNAGFATHFRAGDGGERIRRLQRNAVNVMALNTLLFSSAAVRPMVKAGQGHIINIASTAAWTYTGNYSAIKSYVLTYTQSLALELEGTGVTATAVCPAWMHTNFHSVAGLAEPAIPEWLYVRPEQVVSETLRAVRRGKSLVIPTRRWRLIIWCLTHGPRAWRRQFTKAYLRTKNYRH